MFGRNAELLRSVNTLARTKGVRAFQPELAIALSESAEVFRLAFQL